MPEFRTTFTTPYQRHADREGQPFTVLAFIDQADAEHNAETPPIYRIRFADGFVTDAWPEEVETADSRARQWLEFTLDSGDHGVGWLRWRFTYDQRHGEPADALEQAISAWLATEPGGIEDSLSEALDAVPDQVLATVGLRRVIERDYDEIELVDRLLQS